MHCSALHRTATHCNALHRHCTSLHRTAVREGCRRHCNTLQHTATHCNALCCADDVDVAATHCNTLQHTATHCQNLPKSAPHSHPPPPLPAVICRCPIAGNKLRRTDPKCERSARCSLLQFVAVCCKCVAMFCSVLQQAPTCRPQIREVSASCCCLLQCAASCCCLLQCAANVLEYFVVCCNKLRRADPRCERLARAYIHAYTHTHVHTMHTHTHAHTRTRTRVHTLSNTLT